MKFVFPQKISRNRIILISSIALVLAFGIFQYYKLSKALNETSSREEMFKATIQSLEEKLIQAEEENTQLSNSLEAETERNNSLSRQIESAASKVGTLEKLFQTDTELLRKYSRVYFLNENYVPAHLAKIDEKYLSEKNTEKFIHANVEKYLYMLMDDADFNGVPLQIVSAYRSFGEQNSLKGSYIITYGSGANKFAADQGYSEHQLGTTVDFTTPKLGSSFTKIETELVYQWLLENAYKYGFILSYPKGNAYYQFEPWHWRFVGVILADELHKRDQHFYDMSQREIDTYLIDIFD